MQGTEEASLDFESQEVEPRAETLVGDLRSKRGEGDSTEPTPVEPKLFDFSGWGTSQFEAVYWGKAAELEGTNRAGFERYILGAWCEEDVEAGFMALEDNFEGGAGGRGRR